MKLNAIKRVCKRDGEYVIFNEDDGRQWIGTANACYEVQGVRLQDWSLGALLDVNLTGEEVRTERFETSFLCPVDDALPGDLEPMLGISRSGEMLYTFSDGKRIYLVNEVFVRPTQGRNSAYGTFRLTANEHGDPLILIGDGMITTAIVKPEQEGFAGIIVQRLKDMAAMSC